MCPPDQGCRDRGSILIKDITRVLVADWHTASILELVGVVGPCLLAVVDYNSLVHPLHALTGDGEDTQVWIRGRGIVSQPLVDNLAVLLHVKRANTAVGKAARC